MKMFIGTEYVVVRHIRCSVMVTAGAKNVLMLSTTANLKLLLL